MRFSGSRQVHYRIYFVTVERGKTPNKPIKRTRLRLAAYRQR
jgi:hypothetical protein